MKVNFCKVDVDVGKELSELHGVNCMPTFVFLKDGIEVDRLEGADQEELKRKVENLL